MPKILRGRFGRIAIRVACPLDGAELPQYEDQFSSSSDRRRPCEGSIVDAFLDCSTELLGRTRRIDNAALVRATIHVALDRDTGVERGTHVIDICGISQDTLDTSARRNT
jgi:hypothetical protein